jgi:hypothetical protein
MKLKIRGNYFSGNLLSDSNVPMVNKVSSQIIGAGGNGSSILQNIPTISNNGNNEPKTFFDFLNQNLNSVLWAFVATLVILVIIIYLNYMRGIKKLKN